MKAKIFTLMICLITGVTFSVYGQMNLGTGVNWSEMDPTTDLMLNEDFTGFEFFHSDDNPNEGNSEHVLDNDGVTIIPGYKNDTVEVSVYENPTGKIKYYFTQCAFAPEWATSYGYRDGAQTDNVSNGFVEISRFDTTYSTIPTLAGSMVVDLRELEAVEMIQWTHSSTGGGKRGVLCEISLDEGVTWDTLRYQPGELWGYSFTKDVFGIKTTNGYRCDPSGYGMTWADRVDVYDQKVMLRFACVVPPAGAIQTVRIHDLKVYGTYTPPTSANIIEEDGLKIFAANKKIRISEEAEVKVYTIAGTLVKQSNGASIISMNDMPNGIYLVNAISGTKVKTAKVFIQ